MQNSASELDVRVGQVYTPVEWAMWLIDEAALFDPWVRGATVCDPTCGRGSFIEAFIKLARVRGVPITTDMISRLHGIDIDPICKNNVLDRVAFHGLTLPERNIRIDDILAHDCDQRFDILVGNPPWINFSDLPANLRKRWANHYLTYKLVASRKDVLLGGSRADIATAVLKKVFDINLVDKGSAAFFIPLSLFFNDGANDRFRPYPDSDHRYCIRRLWDFGEKLIFEGISTRYGAIKVSNERDQKFPVKTEVFVNQRWSKSYSTPCDGRQGFWQQHDSPQKHRNRTPSIPASPHQRPRQGVNTCGANDIFIFESNDGVLIDSRGVAIDIEERLIFPLINQSIFSVSSKKRSLRYILIPHNTVTGRPFTAREMLDFPKASKYLQQHEHFLSNRKGTMINSHIQRGMWWALLGVGLYSFAPWKVVWEALGKRQFKPTVVRGEWQGNQAMHAFCPCNSEQEANDLLRHLGEGSIQSFLMASSMDGTMNWAQPGRIAKIFDFRDEQTALDL